MKHFGKCSLLLVFLLLAMGLAGCQKRENATKTGENGYQIYYLNTSLTKLVSRTYETETPSGDTESLIQELMEQILKVPDDLDAQAVLTEKVVYQGYRQEDMVLSLFFDTNYTSMKPYREILCRAALTKTLTQIAGIDYINIYSANQPLLDTNGMPVGLLSASDFVDGITDVNAYEQAELTLYFTDETGEKLYPEKRSVMHNINTSVEKVIIDELISGPETDGLKPTLDSAVKVLNVSVNENVCYINFDTSFLNNALEVKDYIPIYSIVNSLSELSSVNRVQITVNGDQNGMFRDSISLNTMFERNLDYVGSR